MRPRPDRQVWRACALAVLTVTPLGTSGAQESLFERLNLDRLQLTALGAAVGATEPSQLEPTQLYALYSDYGEIAPRWRVVFTVTFWRSRYEDEVVQHFMDSLSRVIIDPSGDDLVRPTEVTLSDIVLGADLRWSPRATGFARPYVGGGLYAHVVNAEGPLIDGTFIERALDNITAGMSGVAGLELFVLRRLSLGAQARYDLVTGSRFSSLRAGASYHFGPPAPPREQ